MRGIRLSLPQPDVFRVQLRALRRAALAGDAQDHAADGGDAARPGAGRARFSTPSSPISPPQGRPTPGRRSASWSRCRRRRHRRRPLRRRFLLHRLQRPDPVRDGRRARHRRRRRYADAANPAVLQPDPPDRSSRQRPGARSACAAMPPPTPPSSRSCSTPACAPSRFRRSAVGRVKPAIAPRRDSHERRLMQRQASLTTSPGRTSASCARARPPPLRHAAAPGRRARHQPQLRLADHQSGLSGADPAAPSRD